MSMKLYTKKNNWKCDISLHVMYMFLKNNIYWCNLGKSRI